MWSQGKILCYDIVSKLISSGAKALASLMLDSFTVYIYIYLMNELFPVLIMHSLGNHDI